MIIAKNKKIKGIVRLITRFQTSIIIALIGLVLIGAGLSIQKIFTSSDAKENIRQETKGDLENDVAVDVEGAVGKPGMISLFAGARIDDAIKKAGGFAQDADREYIAKNINLASVVKDGQKIYIPKVGETVSDSNGNALSSNSKSTLVNINTATESELDSLPGIGPVRAGKIIANRPYASINDLLTKKVLGEATFEKIKDQISVQ